MSESPNINEPSAKLGLSSIARRSSRSPSEKLYGVNAGVDITKCCMSLGQVFIERQGFARGLFRFAATFQRRNVAAQAESCRGIS